MDSEVRLLIVEDEISLAGVLAQYLGINYRVTVAHSLQEASLQLYSNAFEIAVIDKNLPDGTGFDFAKTLQNQSPCTALIMMTGDDDLIDVARALERGIDDYVIKSDSIVVQLMVRIPIALRNANLRTVAASISGTFSIKCPEIESEISNASFEEAKRIVERNYLIKALEILSGDATALATKLQISRSTLFRKLTEHEISLRKWGRERFEPSLSRKSGSYV